MYSSHSLLTWVGHIDDKLLLDEVANVACGTPSKVIEYIVQTIVSQAESAQVHFNQITSYSDNKLMTFMAKINECNTIIKSKVSSTTTIYTNELIVNLNIIKSSAAKQMAILEKNIIDNVFSIKNSTKRSMIYLAKNLSQWASTINSIASIKVDNYKTTIVHYKNNVIKGAENTLAEYQDNITRYASELKNSALRQRVRIEEKLTSSFATIELLSPTQTLKRGYCLSIGTSGVIKSLESAKKETVFTLRFADGEGQVELTKESPA